jgi:hypothetical protein
VNRTFRFALAAALLLAVPSFVDAQRAGRTTNPPAAPRARPVAVHAVPAHATAGRKAPRAKAANSGAPLGDPLTIQQLLDPFPRFGFDFEHLNAIDRDLAIKALIDPITEQRLALAERIGRRRSGFGNSGFFLLDGGGAYVMPSGPDGSDQAPAQSPQPQVIVVQMPATEKSSQGFAPATDTPESAPLPDVGEFTLILRNGSQIHAVAFTRMDDKIVYITPSGGRHTLAVADLDTDSTERTNQENGTPLQLSL